MIEVKNLFKQFDDRPVLQGLDFMVKKGEILGFLGPNGAGKSTTMKIITGFWQPTSGQVLVDGQAVSNNSLASRRKIGYLPETVPLYDDLKVFEYLRFIAEMRNLDKDKIIGRLREVIKLCGLTKVVGQLIGELSKGFRQRVGLAQAIIHQPEILILDEPTTGLDPNQIMEIRALIKELGKEKTVIFSTHILAEASATCDRVIIINQGLIVGEGTPSELAERAGNSNELNLKIKGPKETLEMVKNKIKDIPGVSIEQSRPGLEEIFRELTK